MVTAKHTFLAVLLACAALAPPAVAQVSAPRLVLEGDEELDVAGAAEASPRPERAEARDHGPSAAEPATEPRTPAPAPPPLTASSTLPAPAPPADELARRPVPVATSWAELMRHWEDRRNALREQDPARAARAEAALLDARRQLAIRNLPAFAASEVRASAHALGANLPDLALRRAEVAVRLAPDHADAHLALARARFALAPLEPAPVLAAIRDASVAAVSDPRTVRAFQGDLAAAAIAGFFTAAALAIVLLFARRARQLLHDFHHLPLLSGGQPAQAGFLALVLLGTPAAFGLGPFATLAGLALAAFPYLARRERVVVTVALAGLVALPFAIGASARAVAWTGTAAETVFALEHGVLPEDEVRELARRAEERPAHAELHAALGRWHKRRGALDEAERWYAKAATADPGAPALQVNVGNVRLLKGDLQGAKAAYLAAGDRAGDDLQVAAAAHYDLSKLYLRTSDMEKASASRERAEREDPSFLREYGSDDDFAANWHLVDVPVPAERIRALAAADDSPRALEDTARARVFGPLPRALFPGGPLVLLAGMWGFAFAAGRLRTSRSCARCGRAACPRCGGASEALCGQCVNVFTRRGVVDPRDRLRKEAQVGRHARLARAASRSLALVCGGAGHLHLGLAGRGFAVLFFVLFAAFLLWFWRGVTPPPHPSPWVFAGKLLFAVPVGVGLWAWSVRDVFRRTR